MRSTIIFSIVSLLAQQATPASAQLDSAKIIGSHGSYISTKVRSSADLELNAADYLRRRTEDYFSSTKPNPPVIAAINKDAAPAPSSSMAATAMATMNTSTPTGPVNLNPMLNDTQAACMAVLNTAQPTDDSGMAACFNINFFDNSTGQFQANMLLFKLASPAGNWSSLQPGSVHLALSFPGATASTMPSTANTNQKPASRRSLAPRAGPMMLEAYTLLGSISAPFNGSAALMNSTAMRAALTPVITLMATSVGSMNLTTNMTAPAGAAFVNGWFSDADIAQKAAAAAAAAMPVPFVLPGVTLGMFPIGLIVTSIWVALFVGSVGYGTLGRMQWRKAYRAQKPGASGK